MTFYGMLMVGMVRFGNENWERARIQRSRGVLNLWDFPLSAHLPGAHQLSSQGGPLVYSGRQRAMWHLLHVTWSLLRGLQAASHVALVAACGSNRMVMTTSSAVVLVAAYGCRCGPAL
eukprot:1159695-Pelagomonas_calceolata.AAC.1